jgi:hypothetical protein
MPRYFFNLHFDGDVSRDPVGVEVSDLDHAIAEAKIARAWEEALRIEEAPHDPLPLWTKLATRILTAVGDGEHDPQRLKQIALTALDAQR